MGDPIAHFCYPVILKDNLAAGSTGRGFQTQARWQQAF
jgi:hypothetical protein